jgi:hypothetical protein
VATLRIVAAGRDGSLAGTWSAQTSNGDKGGRALVNLRALGTSTPAILLTPVPGQACPIIDPAGSALAGTFLLELTGTPTRLSGISRYLACEGPVEGRVELTRQ